MVMRMWMSCSQLWCMREFLLGCELSVLIGERVRWRRKKWHFVCTVIGILISRCSYVFLPDYLFVPSFLLCLQCLERKQFSVWKSQAHPNEVSFHLVLLWMKNRHHPLPCYPDDFCRLLPLKSLQILHLYWSMNLMMLLYQRRKITIMGNPPVQPLPRMNLQFPHLWIKFPSLLSKINVMFGFWL